MRTIATLIAALAPLAVARAGDAAELNILGFANDGAIFAFEEYGVQDGSGFPYANRFYIDVAADKFVAGSPIRVVLEDESAETATARAKAAEAGAAIVADAELAANRGFTAASRAITQDSDNPLELTFNPRPVFPPIDPRMGFRLETFDLAPPQGCGVEDKTKAFRLVRLNPDAQDGAALIHEDKSIPQSRRCPLDYRLGAVQTWFDSAGKGVFAVLIAVVSRGFEGPDHRWIAITGKI